ncbi:hypothetical protein TIFTF001_008161 [Ficus carica]|uniref:TORTIFOLIA1/SINE1-2 N-terminal domain-containing protein n=1 Tax=Ficus carica TaxID=3494 RepID=A0AA88DGW9_FICCA|nr:hypothetical protein TIFTF001_008161 [Ficus carica]
MGRSFSPILRRELANLDKDADSRRSAMKALKSYVKDLDSKAIPLFLAQVSQTKETGLSGECTISLYEVLARVHGVKIVPQIDSIMVTIVKTLASSAGFFPLQQACSKVVPAIARYAIEPTTPEDQKRHIIHSLCSPLSDSLLGSQESLTSGAALCLKALVDSDNWRFASGEMVNKVCQIVAGALEEKPTQTNAHMGLVMALAKRNSSVVEPYARLLIQAGLQILNAGVVEGNSQKRLSSIQTVNFLMKWLDPWSFYSELQLVIEEMEKCQSDQMAYVRGAAFEALQTAKRIAADKDSKFDKSPGSITGSNFTRRDHIRCFLSTPGDRSPASVSPESQTLDSYVEYEGWVESPTSTRQASQIFDYDCRSVNRKLWSFENGGVDVSLKDGLFSQIAREDTISNTEHSRDNEFGKNDGDHEEFAGFLQKNPRNGMSKSTTTSPLRSRTSINVDNIIFRTPRKLVHSLQDTNNMNSDCSEKLGRRLRSLSLSDFEWSPVSGCGQNFEKALEGNSESVSSTNDIPAHADEHKVSDKAILQDHETRAPNSGNKKHCHRAVLKLVFYLLFALVAVFTLLVGMSDRDEFDGHYLVPT